MSIDASTRSDAGVSVVPSSAQDWQNWVSATDTRNFLLQDTLLDWLDLYGEYNGFSLIPIYPDMTLERASPSLFLRRLESLKQRL
jgi:hypothetical protein